MIHKFNFQSVLSTYPFLSYLLPGIKDFRGQEQKYDLKIMIIFTLG